ncbi:MAG: TolB family protein [Patescibacteria group bacterium]
MKKIFIIIGFILVVIALGFLLYLILLKPAPKPIPVIPPEKEVPLRLPVTRQVWERMTIEERERLGLPLYEWPEVAPPTLPPVEVPPVPEISEVAQGGPTWINPVSVERSEAVELAADGINAIYYNRDTGRFYKITPDGQKELLTDQVFKNVQKITWAPTKDKAILEFPDGYKIVYDFEKKKQVTLPFNWYDFSFNPSGTEFVFKTASKYPENRWLSIANADGTNPRAIEHMGENQDKVIVSWSPNNQVIAFSKTGEPRGAWVHSILPIGRYGERFPPIVVDGLGFENIWSPNGEKIAYSVYSPETNYNPMLYVIGAYGDEMGRGKIYTGLATYSYKCTFNQAGDTLYCAVPRNLPYGSGLVPELAAGTKDDFYKVDLKTGRSSFLAESAFGSYEVEKVFLSQDESLLYFVDKNTKMIRYIRLK